MIAGDGLRRLPLSRLRRPGVGGADGMTWLTRGCGVVLALSALWCVVSAVRPLPDATPPDVERVPDSFPALAEPRPLDARRTWLATLNGTNAFDAQGLAWSTRDDQAKPIEKAAAPATEASPVKAPAASESVSIGGQSVLVTKTESLPDDVKQALAGLVLRGIYRMRDGAAVALISRVHGIPNPLVSDPFREGDEFEDKQFPKAKWRVVAIDAEYRRVVLQRSGVNTALEMYAAPAVSAVSVATTAAAPQPPGATIAVQTKDEASAALREAGVSDADIKRLLELAEMSPDEASTAAAIDALAKAAREQPDAGTTGRRPPPPGLEAIARLLQQTPTKEPGSEEPPRKRKQP